MERFGKYELLAKLGQGGMAEVFLARAVLAEGLQKLLAIKKIHTAFSETPRFLSMFQEEAKIALDLNHPNVVQVFDYGSLGGTFFLVMEYVDGMDLMRLIKKALRTLPFGLSAYIVQQLALGLSYAHRKRDAYGTPLEIVHRDISPQNVLISMDGAVKLVDFGIAKARDQQEEEGVVKGKFAYMSPEQASGRAVDARADIYSTGILLYELVTGRTPFGHLRGKEALQAVQKAEIPLPSSLAPDLPEMIEGIILKAIEPDLTRRYQTAQQLQTDLTRFLYAQHGASGEIYDAAALSRFLQNDVPASERFNASSLIRAEAGSISEVGPKDESVEIFGDRASTDTEVTERKNVVAVHGALEGMESFEQTVTHDRAKAVLASYRAVVEDVAYKLDARLKKFDASGFTLLLGVPVSSEDDPSRAIRLARSVRDAWEAIIKDLATGFELKLGVARGLAEVRRGRQIGFEYKLLGPVLERVSLLAQLEESGSIVVGAGVFQVARNEWNFDPIEDTERVLGLPQTKAETQTESRPVRAFKLIGPKPRREQRELALSGAIVGRELEVKGFHDAYRQAIILRNTKLLAVIGEAGVGKRSLVEAFLRQLEPKPSRVVRATGRLWNGNLPYSLLSDLCRDLLGVEEWTRPADVARRADELAASLWPDEPDQAALNKDVFLLMLGAAPPASLKVPVDPELRQRTIGRSLHGVLDRLARQGPVVVVLEEFHWADFQSRQLVSTFAQQPPRKPILAVLTSRPDEMLEELVKKTHADPFYLKELSPEDSLRYVISFFADPASAEALARQVLIKGGGNPYYLKSILDSLCDQGLVRPKPDDPEHRLEMVSTEISVLLPPTVEALVSARLDQLPSRVRTLLRKASVFGRTFKRKELVAISDGEVDEELEALKDRGLIVPVQDEPDRFEFTKQVIVDIAYQGLSAADRKKLHRQAAEFLEKESPDLQGQDGRVGRHYELAGMNEEAGQSYLKAAGRAKALCADKEAFHFLTRAKDLLPASPETLFDIRLAIEEILKNWGKRDEQARELKELEELAKATQNPAHMAEVLNRWMHYLQNISRHKASLKIFERAWKAAVESKSVDLMAEALWRKARALSELGDNTEALQAIHKARSLVPEEHQNTEVWGRTWHVEGNALFYLGDYRKAVVSYGKARDIYSKLGLKRQEAIILNNMGFLSLNLGLFEDSEQYLKASYNIEVELGSRDSLGVKLSNLGQVYNSVGLLDKALKHLNKAEEISRALKDISIQADAVVSIGQNHMLRGEIDKAVSELKRGLDLAHMSDSRYDVVRAQIYLAMALLRKSDGVGEALTLAEQAVELSRKSRMPQGEVFGLSVQANALSRYQKLDEAVGLSAQAVARMSTCGHVAEAEVVLHTHARLLTQAGRSEEAMPYLQKAVEAIRRKHAQTKNEQWRKSYLSIPPANEILSDLRRFFPNTEPFEDS